MGCEVLTLDKRRFPFYKEVDGCHVLGISFNAKDYSVIDCESFWALGTKEDAEQFIRQRSEGERSACQAKELLTNLTGQICKGGACDLPT